MIFFARWTGGTSGPAGPKDVAGDSWSVLSGERIQGQAQHSRKAV